MSYLYIYVFFSVQKFISRDDRCRYFQKRKPDGVATFVTACTKIDWNIFTMIGDIPRGIWQSCTAIAFFKNKATAKLRSKTICNTHSTSRLK